MKFTYRIVIILLLTTIVATVGLIINTHYRILPYDEYISPEKGKVKLDAGLYYVYDGALRRQSQSILVTDLNYGKAIVETLKANTEESALHSIFDYKIEISSINQVNDICYINFNQSAELLELWKEDDLALYIWSLVNSLTETNQINSVQFLINGKQYNRWINDFNLSNPLPRMETYIYTKDKTAADTVIEFIENIEYMRFDLAYSLISKESMTQYDYSSFVRYANSFLEQYRGFDIIPNYTKVLTDHEEVILKLTRWIEVDGYAQQMFKKWYVLQEDGAFRIDILNEY